MGGKGGFGSLLKSQKGGKKTVNFDSSRDISGRRLRHAKVIDRLKEWIQKKREDDEIVRQLTEGLDKMDVSKAKELNADYVKEMRSRARQMESLVREGFQFEKQRIDELNKRGGKGTYEAFKWKKLFFERDLEFSDSDDEAGDESCSYLSNSPAPIMSTATNDALEAREDDKKQYIVDPIDPTAAPQAAEAAGDDLADEDSEDENSDIDEFFVGGDEVDEQKIASFFLGDHLEMDEEKIRRFMAATARTAAMDAESIINKRKAD